MEIQKDDLLALIEDVWSTLIGLDIHELDDRPRQQDDEPSVSASVKISGTWRGAVAVVCPETMARRIASAMFEMDALQVSGEDVGDCIGELANVIAGHVKAASLLPGDVSLPEVAFGPRSSFASTSEQQAWMTCEGETISVSIIKPSEAEIAKSTCAAAKNERPEQ